RHHKKEKWKFESLGEEATLETCLVNLSFLLVIEQCNSPEDCSRAIKWLSLIRQAMKGKRHDNSEQPANCSNTINCDTKKSSSCNDQQHPRKSHLYSIPIEDQHDQKNLDIFRNLYQHISSLKASCVGTGIMGYLGNKGSVSISTTLYQTTFCIVCSHLVSGEKDGDAFRKNSDITEIFMKTRFSHPCKIQEKLVRPDCFLDHE
ncbi:type I inositol polyphosphate 5-phosphatase 8-like, partial [Olea europaea var. sylvestris]|uniref:type I inositol polyphosphate 5-phosphatase 8-like n=1 Tax=Olea europaea var. sylvestris TaxID=158386 RepID=UPI000C1CD05A